MTAGYISSITKLIAQTSYRVFDSVTFSLPSKIVRKSCKTVLHTMSTVNNQEKHNGKSCFISASISTAAATISSRVVNMQIKVNNSAVLQPPFPIKFFSKCLLYRRIQPKNKKKKPYKIRRHHNSKILVLYLNSSVTKHNQQMHKNSLPPRPSKTRQINQTQKPMMLLFLFFLFSRRSSSLQIRH